MFNQIYTSVWSKYRPVIIQLMMSAQEGPAEYKLSAHEFKALNPKERSYSFELHAYKGKATNNIKTSANANDLLLMLNASKKAKELLEEGSFGFTLDKQFVLHVVKLEVPAL